MLGGALKVVARADIESASTEINPPLYQLSYLHLKVAPGEGIEPSRLPYLDYLEYPFLS